MPGGQSLREAHVGHKYFKTRTSCKVSRGDWSCRHKFAHWILYTWIHLSLWAACFKIMIFDLIVWQRFCEPARLRIRNCPSVFRVFVGHLILLWMQPSSCPVMYSLEYAIDVPTAIFFKWHPPWDFRGRPNSTTVPMETGSVYFPRLLHLNLLLRSSEVSPAFCLEYLMKAVNSVLLMGMWSL